MSRVAKQPIQLPKGVDLSIADGQIRVKGPKGQLSFAQPSGVGIAMEDGAANFSWENEASHAMAGTTRAIVNNMVTGVSEGFTKKLELVGVGYRATMVGSDLNLTLGFSHPVLFKVPDGISIETPTQTEVLVRGADRQQVGQVAAKIRGFRPPEPYKGKGVRYAGERIIMKEAKKA